MKIFAVLILFIAAPFISACADPLPPSSPSLKDRSFIFSWPGQSSSASVINRTEPIVTDRPSFTDSSRTVGKNVTQAELGYLYQYTQKTDNHEASHFYPDLSLRQGIFADWFELRFAQTLTSFDQPDNNTTAINDPIIGARLGLFAQHGFLPELSITPGLQLPIGSSSVRNNKVLPTIGSSYSWNLTAHLALSGATNFITSERDVDAARFRAWTQTAMATLKTSDRVSVWIEGYTALPQSIALKKDTYYLDAGVMYLTSANTQLDIRIGSRLQGNFGQDIIAGFGVSTRWG
jgi:hypothetical protein